MRRFLSITGFLAFAFLPLQAQSAYPDRPVHLLVGFAPGGGTDALARLVGNKLAEKWGQPVIVENREGANGTIAENLVAHAQPDGYTLVLVPNPHTIAPAQMKLSYDPIKSFAPVTLLVEAPDLLVINPSVLPVKNAKELIALAKSKPGQLNFGSPGTSSPNFLEMAVFMKGSGIDMVNVSYKGGTAAAFVAVLGGEVQAMFGSVAVVGGQVKAGKLIALGVGGSFRLPSFPDVPPIAEAADIPGYDESVWDGILAPAGTPKEIIARLHDDIVEAIKSPQLAADLQKLGFFPVANTPEEFGAFIEKDIQKWVGLMKTLNIKD